MSAVKLSLSSGFRIDKKILQIAQNLNDDRLRSVTKTNSSGNAPSLMSEHHLSKCQSSFIADYLIIFWKKVDSLEAEV